MGLSSAAALGIANPTQERMRWRLSPVASATLCVHISPKRQAAHADAASTTAAAAALTWEDGGPVASSAPPLLEGPPADADRAGALVVVGRSREVLASAAVRWWGKQATCNTGQGHDGA